MALPDMEELRTPDPDPLGGRFRNIPEPPHECLDCGVALDDPEVRYCFACAPDDAALTLDAERPLDADGEVGVPDHLRTPFEQIDPVGADA